MAHPVGTGPKAIVYVVCQEYGGLGDQAFALKMYDIFKKSLPEDVSVFLVPMNEKTEAGFRRLKADCPLISLDSLKEHAGEVPTLIVNGPVISSEKEIFGEATSKRDRIKIWPISEYSVKTVGSKSDVSGPGADELGIFCEGDLYTLGKALQTDKKTSDPTHIEHLRDSAFKELLLKNKDQQYYCGYATNEDSCYLFAKDVIELTALSEKDIDLCFVNGMEKTFLHPFGHEPIDSLPGAENLEIWQMNPDRSMKLLFSQKKNESARRVRIFLPRRLPHENFLHLLIASQPQVLVTGDQSLSEAIALRKVVRYEQSSHKERLRLNLMQLAHDSGLSRLEELFSYKSYIPIPRELLITLHNADLLEEAGKFTDIIYEKHNLERKVTAKALEWLSDCTA